MILVILTALTAVCGAAKLNTGYLPPLSARTAGGSPGALQAPFDGTSQGFPTGSYTNDAQGVIVDAVNPGTRTSGAEPTGLGGPRASYGSTNSKVGDAAFSGSGIRNSGGVSTRIAPGFDSIVGSEDSEAAKTRGSTLKFATDVGLNNYSYGFETDNGISVGENGVAENGVQAQGGYSYKGNDGKTYKVTYTADEGGYKPEGQHLPTPPPIPDEILKSLEKNAKEEAAGLVDDGSYDAQKYNDGGDYSSNGAAHNNAIPTLGGGDATASSFVNQGNQVYRPTSGLLIGSYNPGSAASQSTQPQGAQGYGQASGNTQSGFSLNKDQIGSQVFGISGNGAAIGGQFGQAGSTLNSQSTVNKFGVQASKPEGSLFGSPVRTPSFNNLPGSPSENSAFSSAVTSGFGSATAFASTSSPGYELKNDIIPATNNFGSADRYNEGIKSGSDSSVGASFPAQSTSVASASVSGTPTFGQQYSGSQQPSIQGSTVSPQFSYTTPAPSNTKFGSPSYSQSGQSSGVGFNNEYLAPVNAFGSTGKVSYGSNIPEVNSQNQSPILPSSASASASVNQPNIGQANQYFNGFKAESNQNSFPSRFGESQQSGNSATNSEYLPPVNIIESTSGPNLHSKPQGFDSSSTASAVNLQSSPSISAKPPGSGSSSFGISSQGSSFQTQSLNSKPGQYSPVNNVISPSAGLPQFGNTNTQFSSVQPTKPTVGFGSISTQGPTKVPDTELTTPFESNGPTSALNYQTSNQVSNTFISGNNPVPTPTPASSIFSSQQGSQSSSVFGSQSKFPSQEASGHYKPTFSQGSFPQTASTDASTQQPALSQQQGSDDSYHYKQPSKPFVTPPLSLGNQFTNNLQPNEPVSSLSQQGSKYPSSSSYNSGVTQAAISSFPSGSSSSGQFSSQSNQFGSKPTLSTQFGQSSQSSLQASSQFGTIGAQQTPSQKPISQFNQKPIVQSQAQFGQTPISQNSDSSQSLTQQYQGTIYQYNKPGETLPEPANIDSQAKPSQISTDSSFGSQQVSSQFSSQSTGGKPTSTFQQTQTASNSLFGQKPNSQGQFAQTSQFGQKPLSNSQTIDSYYHQSQVSGSGTQFSLKPQKPLGSTFSSNTQSQQSLFGKKPTPSTQSVSYYPQATSSTGLSSSSVTQKPSSFGQTPFGSSQTSGSFVGQTTQSSSFTSNSQSQTSQLGQKPFGSAFQKPYFGSTSTQSGQGSGLASTAGQTLVGQKPFGSTGFQFGQKPQLTQGSSFTTTTGSKGQSAPTPQFGVTGASQNSQSLQGNSFASTTGQTSFGQKPTGSSYQQSQFESTSSQFSSQFGQKPQSLTQSSSFTSNTGSKGQSAQTSQFGVTGASQNAQSLQGNGFDSTTGQTLFGQKPTGSSYQQSQFESTSSQFGQNSQAQGSGSLSSAGQSSFGQKPSTIKPTGATNQQLGSTSSQFGFGQKPQSAQGSYFTSNTGSKGQSTQTSQFGVTSTSQNSQSLQGNGFASTTGQTLFGQKPTGSSYQQSQFESTSSQFSSQFGQKPQSLTQSSSFTSNTGSKGQSAQTSQFGVTGASQNSQSLQGNGFDSTTGQTLFGQKPTGSSYQQSQFESTSSQIGQNYQAQGSGSLSSASQSAFGQKPSTIKPTGSTNQQFGSTGSQFGFGQKPQSAQGSYFTTNTGSKGQSVQNSQFGVTGSSHSSFGQKPAGSYQQSQFGTTGSKFGEKPQITQGSSFSSNSLSQTQTSQLGKKPASSIQSAFQQTQFGSTTSQSSQNSQSQGNGLFSSVGQSSFGQKPFTTKPIGSTNQSFGSTNSQFGSTNLQFGSTNSQFGFGSKPQGSYFASNTGSKGQSGQTSQFGVTGSSQNTGSGSSIGLGSSYQQTQTSGFSGSKFGQKPQTTSATVSQPSAQFGVKPFGSQISQGFQQTQLGSTSQSSQANVPTSTTISQTAQSTQFGQKPSGVSQATFQENTFGSSGSVFGQKPLITQTVQKPSSTFGSYSQSSQFGTQTKKPFSNTQTPFLSQFSSTTGQFEQQPQAQANAFASSSNPDAAKFSSTQSSQVSKYQQTSQFGVQGQKPVQSSLSQTNYQQSQYTQTSGSQTNVGSGQLGGQSSFGVQAQKPTGSQFSTFQTQFNQGKKPIGSSQGSAFQIGQSADQKTQPTQSSITTTNLASQSAENSFGSGQSSIGYGYNKPQNAFNFASQFGSQASVPKDQKVQSTQTNFNSGVSTSQTQIGVEPIKPFGSSSGQGSFQNSHSSLGGSQFDVQPTQATDSSISPSQSSLSQFSGQPFQPASTVSTLSSSFQSGSSSTANSQFGIQPTKPSVIPHFSGQPFKPASTQASSSFGSQSLFGLQSSQNVASSTQKPSQTQFSIAPFKTEFSSTPAPSIPSKLGSNFSSKPEGQVVSTLQTPIVPIPGYEINTSTQGTIGGEFGGPRDPPKFDDKTGYYY